VDNLASSALATDAARGRIEDANYANETTALARSQIIAQAGTAMLAQANLRAQSVLDLLQ
jgi:flagellin